MTARHPFFWLGAGLLALSGCSAVLDDPTPFVAQSDQAVAPADEGVSDAAVVVDSAVRKDAAVMDDAAKPDMATDASADAAVIVADSGPVDEGITPDACPSAVEICDGEDNDCDGEIDETVAGALDDECQPCGPDRGQGICGLGATLCVGGELVCVAQLPLAGDTPPCDLLDNDCDGSIDEGTEIVPASSPLEIQLRSACGVPATQSATPPEPPCSLDPRRVGCSAAHACVPQACREACEQTRADTLLCPECADDSCRYDCRSGAEATYLTCLAACSEIEQGGATEWTCAGGEAGPVCTPTSCPEGTRPAGQTCEPNVEICNNGLDDDGDGLIDGTLDGDDPCAAAFDPRGAPRQMGVCENPNLPGCEDSQRMVGDQPSGSASRCTGADCPRLVTASYQFAIDREEVSIRAYQACVERGCCLPPTGRSYQLAVRAMADGLSPARPDNPERCAPPVDVLDAGQAALLPDLPITGVTWCQARDYCNWVGKRLPTEFEWETAATGLGPQRRIYPWGDARPAQCREDQCCKGPEHEGPVPGLCDGDVPICEVENPAATRVSCLAMYAPDTNGVCQPLTGATPVYANQDGATPDGLLNMSGNVVEWVFDWNSDNYDRLNRVDPVGEACDQDDFPSKKVTRGDMFSSNGNDLRVFVRDSLFPPTRAPIIGFRCGRTLPDAGGMCNPQVEDVRPACLPGADLPNGVPGQVLPACAAPDFVSANAEDLAGCPGRLSRHHPTCTEGLGDFCASDTVAGCGSFLLSRMRILPGLIEGGSIGGLVNTLFDSTLGPQGGTTLFAISLPENFENLSREWNARFGSAEINADGNLAWVGEFDQGLCDEQPSLPFRVRTTIGQSAIRPICRAVGHGRLVFKASPVSVAFSAIGLSANHSAVAGTLSGTLAVVTTLGDIADSSFGTDPNPSGLENLLESAGLDAINLCNQPLVPVSPECAAEPLVMPGCLDGECTDPQTCRGFVLPFEFEALRANRAGIPGLDACQ